MKAFGGALLGLIIAALLIILPWRGADALSARRPTFRRWYAPRRVDHQAPHLRDEIYVVVSGEGWFMRAGERVPFTAGDALFVRAGVPHRFEDFSDDFAAWVIFAGPA